MAVLKCEDGTKLQISAETEAELRKQFGPKPKFKPRDLVYYRVAVRKDITESKVIRLDVKNHYGPDSESRYKHRILSIGEIDNLVSALQDAKAFVEANR